jgi:hypothetical protein
MFKILRKKIQSLSETQQNILTIILILVNVGIIIFWINFWVGLKKITPPKIAEKPKQAEEIAEPLKSGEIGEIAEEETEEKEILPLPQVIFNTTGIIKEVREDYLLVDGDGSNFLDKKPRVLTVKVTEDTVISEKGQKIWYKGFEGLKYLKVGEEITFQATENIRGKTEFFVDSITKI